LGSWIRGFDSHGVYAWLGEIYENARVISEEHDVAGRILKVRGLPSAIARLKRALADS
jgi:GTP-binding protein HflX